MTRFLFVIMAVFWVGCDRGIFEVDAGADGGVDGGTDSGNLTGINCEWSCVYGVDECPGEAVHFNNRICPDFGSGPGMCCGPLEDH